MFKGVGIGMCREMEGLIPLRAKFGFNWSGTERGVGSYVGKQTHQRYPQVLEKFEYTSLAFYRGDSWQNEEVFVKVHPVITHVFEERFCMYSLWLCLKL